jgi:hypothetical protein
VFRCREDIRSTPLPRARRRDADEVDEHADSVPHHRIEPEPLHDLGAAQRTVGQERANTASRRQKSPRLEPASSEPEPPGAAGVTHCRCEQRIVVTGDHVDRGPHQGSPERHFCARVPW